MPTARESVPRVAPGTSLPGRSIASERGTRRWRFRRRPGRSIARAVNGRGVARGTSPRRTRPVLPRLSWSGPLWRGRTDWRRAKAPAEARHSDHREKNRERGAKGEEAHRAGCPCAIIPRRPGPGPGFVSLLPAPLHRIAQFTSFYVHQDNAHSSPRQLARFWPSCRPPTREGSGPDRARATGAYRAGSIGRAGRCESPGRTPINSHIHGSPGPGPSAGWRAASCRPRCRGPRLRPGGRRGSACVATGG